MLAVWSGTIGIRKMIEFFECLEAEQWVWLIIGVVMFSMLCWFVLLLWQDLKLLRRAKKDKK